MTEESQKCPLCDKDARGWPSGMAAYHIECERCGEFLISEELAMDMPGMGEDVVGNRYLLSGMARWNTLRNLKPISLMTTNVNGYISQYENLRVPDRAHKILQYLELRGKHPGSQLKVNMHLDYPFAFCRDAVEFSYYLHEFLKARGLIRCSSANVCMITPKGWEWLEEYGRVNVDSPKAFVAMWFNDKVKAVYEDGIEPAVGSAGYEPVKINLKEYIGKVDDEIIAEIRQSRFLVADFTGHRRGVYFEAGFAMGLGIEVIWCCRKDDIDKLHFDIRNYNCIDWENPKDFRERLERRILAVIGKGPRESK